MRVRPIILWSACLLLSAVISAPPAIASSPTIVPSTIDATGATDVTAKLETFIAGVPDGSTISFPAGARYRIDGSLIIEGRHDLTFEGNGAEFFATTEADRERRHWWIRDSDGITVRDVVVRGANPSAGTGDAAYRADREAQHGFDLAGDNNVLLERVTVTDVYGDFVYIGLGKNDWSKNVTVRDSHFERNGRQGISITAGEDIRIEHNFISDVRRSTFDIEPNGPNWGARRVTISDNDIGPGRLNFIAGHGDAAPFDDVTVIGNRLKGKTMNISLKAPAAQRRSNFSLIGNTSDATFGSSIPAVTIDGFDGVTIRDNVLPLAAGRQMTAVALVSTCNAVVVGNQLLNAATDVSNDGYNCAAASPATTTPTSVVPTSSARSATTSRSSAAAATVAPRVGGAVVNESTDAAPKAAAGNSGASQNPEGESAAALPAPDGRLVDPPSADKGGHDNAIWALVAGAFISLAVLVPLSRHGRRPRPGGEDAPH